MICCPEILSDISVVYSIQVSKFIGQNIQSLLPYKHKKKEVK